MVVNRKPVLLLLRPASVKNSETAEQKGYDGSMLVSGIKRHILKDTQGLPHAIHITTANITDREGAHAILKVLLVLLVLFLMLLMS
jgi:hypothetical protein